MSFIAGTSLGKISITSIRSNVFTAFRCLLPAYNPTFRLNQYTTGNIIQTLKFYDASNLVRFISIFSICFVLIYVYIVYTYTYVGIAT